MTRNRRSLIGQRDLGNLVAEYGYHEVWGPHTTTEEWIEI